MPARTLLAGASEVDVTPPVGVPLAGYGGGARRHLIPKLGNRYDHFLVASTGVRDPIFARALHVSDGHERVTFVTLDAIATTYEVTLAAWQKARALGAKVAFENLMVCSSHTHSGPGCLTRLTFWELLAADLYQDPVFQGFTDGIAKAIVEAEQNAEPATIGAGSGQITNATHNRRAGVSHAFTPTSIDPEALVLRVDRVKDGSALATLWNFGIHGTAFGTDNHLFSADIMGSTSAEIEKAGGGVALFVNSGEGDISPVFGGDAGVRAGGKILADQLLAVRRATTTVPALDVACTSEMIDFGTPTVDLTIQRAAPMLGSLSSQGWFTVLQQLGGGIGFQVKTPAGWLEHEFRYQAIRLGKWGFAALPGEPIHTIALDLKGRGKALGFEQVFTCGLANGHMSYVVTESEYQDGGYEAIATFFGPKTANKLADSSERQMTKVKP